MKYLSKFNEGTDADIISDIKKYIESTKADLYQTIYQYYRRGDGGEVPDINRPTIRIKNFIEMGVKSIKLSTEENISLIKIHDLLKDIADKVENIEDYFTEVTDNGVELEVYCDFYNKIIISIAFKFVEMDDISTKIYSINRVLNRWGLKTKMLSMLVNSGISDVAAYGSRDCKVKLEVI